MSSAIVNDEVLFENWILRFSSLWSSYFLNTLNVIDASHPRFALVSLGRRAVTPRLIACLLRFIAQQLEQAKAIRERAVDSTIPTIKIPSRGKSLPALPPAMFAYAYDIAREDGLVTTSASSDLLTVDTPLVSVTVKLPGVNALAAPTQRSEGPRQGSEFYEKLENRETVVPVTINGKLQERFRLEHRSRNSADKENLPAASADVETRNTRAPRRPGRVTANGMRLLNNTMRGVLFHNDRAAPRRH